MEIVETAWIPMPDGTRLAARLFLPDTRPAPAVLEYLPYRRRDVTAARDEGTYPAYAEAGIAGVRVDLRGTGDSEGAFDDEYSEQELSDAEAVIAWVASQPWCSGAVGMMGISWGGFNALQVAARRPPALKAVISVAATVDRFADDIHYKGGALLSANLYWATQMLGRAALPPDEDVVGETWRDRWLERLAQTPSLAARWHREQARGAYWQHGSICEDDTAIQIPCLVIAGWADGYRNTPWKARESMGERVRAFTGPWVHHYPHYGEPGPSADFIAESIAWWQAHLGHGPKVDMPAHRLWLSEAVRPGARVTEPGFWIAIDQSRDGASYSALSLHFGAETHGLRFTKADSREKQRDNAGPQAHARIARAGSEGTGDECRRATGQAPFPLKTPLRCGADGGEYFTQSGGDLPSDQRGDDGLSAVFDTAPLETKIDIIGMPELTVPLAIDAPQGHLIARLCDVHPDGASHRITLGILNLSHRNGSARPEPMVPGQTEPVTMTFDATSYRLRAGHRLRLALSTTYFPYLLPPPTEVTATLDLDGAELRLPHHPFTEIDLPLGTDTRPAFPRDAEPVTQRSLARETMTGVVSSRVVSQGAELRHPANGLEWQDSRQSIWQATGDDPLSVRADETCTGVRRRNGIETKVIASGKMTVTASHWIIETRLTAYENGDEVFDRSWSDPVARI